LKPRSYTFLTINLRLRSFSAFSSTNRDTIAFLRHPLRNTDLYLIGTSHISAQSVEDVRNVIQRVKPDTVLVELCEKRYEKMFSIKNEVIPYQENFNQFIENLFPPFVRNILKGFQSGFSSGGILGGVIATLYSYLRSIGITPGLEFKTAIEEGKKRNSKIILGDQDQEYTMKRIKEATKNTNWKQFFGTEPPIDIPRNINFRDLKTADTLLDRKRVSNITKWLKENAPELAKAILTERDEHMARELDKCSKEGAQVVVAVVGMAHMDGIQKLWLKDSQKETIKQYL